MNSYQDFADDANELFASVLSDVTTEQWAEFKEQQTKHGMYVIEEDSDIESCDSDYRSSSPTTDEFFTNVELVEQEEEASVSEGSDNETKDGASWGCDAAIKYVNGEISFNELNAIMEDDKPKPRKKGSGSRKKQEPKDACQLEKEDREYQIELSNRYKKQRRRMNKLPKELEGLMGAANMKFAQGNTEDAVKMCMELIRLAPTAQEPFQTLAVIYDETGQPRKSFQYSIVAAYLNPADTEEWIRLAVLSVEQNQLHQAISCYSRAIRNEPTNINFLWERCNLYEQVGDRKRALVGYEMILKQLSNPEDGEKCVEMSREIAKIHHGNKDYTNAIKVLETVFTKFPLLITSEDVNFLLELQMAQKLYKSALKNFMQHCGVTLSFSDQEIASVDKISNSTDEELMHIESCTVPEILPIDLWVKMLMCLIHLQSAKAMQPLLESLKKENPAEIGDLYIDVAESLMDVKNYENAVDLLVILLDTPNYNLPAVWMKYGECLLALSKTDEAIKAFEKVLVMAPACQEARLALSKIHLARKNVEKAITVLRQEYEEGKETVLGIEALYEHCKLLESQELWDEFITAGTLLQYSHCYYVETDEELSAVFANQTPKRRIETLRELKSQSNKIYPEFVGQQISASDMLDIFKKVSRLLMEKKRFAELQHISLIALTSTLLMKNPDVSKDIDFQALLSCFYNKKYYLAYLLVKDLVVKNINNNQAWNLFCLIVTFCQENRHNRFCLRLMMKHQDHLALGYLNGHNAMISGSYKHALGEYMAILKERPNDSFAWFCTGIGFVHMACQKFATKRYFLMIQGLAFLLKYLKLKGENQETLYNLGRALHQLGLKDSAVYYYKKALDAPLVIYGEDQDVFDLRKEIAYNLSLMYQSTGADDLASLYYRKYIVI